MRNIPFGKPIIGEPEKNAVMKVLEADILVHGPKAKEFEAGFREFVGGGYAVSCASCTAALHLAYFYLGLGEGDEVIVPAQTHTATAHAVELVGATPVFVDAEKETGNIDIAQIESAISTNTRALSLVHYLGMPVNMTAINEIAKRHDLFVVEDCALAMGTYFKGKHAGLHGDVGCFSFYPVKHMTTAEGGMLTTTHSEVAGKITYQKAFGVDRTASERSIPGVYDVKMLGLNYRMNEIEAVIGIEQLKRMPDFLAKREANYRALERGLSDIEEVSLFKSSHGDYQSSYYCLSAILGPELSPKRFEIVGNLKEMGVGCSVYYPRPVPHFSYYKEKYGYKETTFPVAKWISDSTIALPVGPHLNVEDMEYITNSLKAAIKRARQ